MAESRHRYPPTTRLEDGSDERSIKKAQHCMVETVKPKGGIVDVVRQTYDELMAWRSGGDFDQRYPRGENHATQEIDVALQRGSPRIYQRLALCEKESNLGEEVVTEAHNRCLL